MSNSQVDFDSPLLRVNTNNLCNTLKSRFTNTLQISFIHLYKQVSSKSFHKCHNRKQKR